MKKILKNKNVTLIPLVPEHKDFFVELANIPQVNQRVNKPFPYTVQHFDETIEKLQKDLHLFVWVIESSGIPCGIINSGAGRHPCMFQGGYWLHPLHWGKGIASLSLAMVKDFLFTECQAQRIQALVEPDNHASIRVLEKCGYQREGLLKSFFPSVNRGLIDVFMYAAVKSHSQ